MDIIKVPVSCSIFEKHFASGNYSHLGAEISDINSILVFLRNDVQLVELQLKPLLLYYTSVFVLKYVNLD